MISSLLEEIAIEMMFSNLVHLKSLLMVLTAAAGTVAGGTMVNSYMGDNGNFANQRATQSFILDISPSTLTIGQNATTTATVTVMSVNGYRGTVGLSVYMPGQRLAITLNPTRVNVPSNGMAKSTLTVTAGNTIANYTVVVIGLATSHGRTLYSSAILRVQVASNQDFTITSNPSVIINTRGATNTTTITVTSLNGFTGNVSLTVTAPFGYITTTGGQTPLTMGTTATSTLTITSNTNTATGNYTITVTGTSGSKTHSTTITLSIVDPTPPPVVESLVMNSHEFFNSTDLTLSLLNNGNTSLTLRSYTVRDSSGDAWTLANWPGPTIDPQTGKITNILIGSSCHGCTYTGITGLFQQFVIGQTYTVILTSARGTQFQFTVIR